MNTDPRTPPWNFLAGPYLDRQAERRDEPDWWEQALADPGTRFMVAHGTTQLVQGERPRVAFLDAAHPLVSSAARESMLLLGWFRESRCVLVQFDEIPAALSLPAPDARFEELRPLAPLLDADEAGLLAYARALAYWRRRHHFCGACGAPCEPQRAGHSMRCTSAACGTEFYPRIDPAIIVLVTDGERALLGRQHSWPAGRYSTIAGFVEPGESLEDAVIREVHEETGVRVRESRYHSSQPWPFPSSLMLGFMAVAEPGSVASGSSELEDARWFTREQIASGTPALPPSTSISYRLIENWFDPGSAVPLRDLPDVGRWEGRRA
jgi:NAD+ diphosphatase